jgi:pyruvate/2-oxoglutarate dehydrogenase complex dihydrolipoamide acyltransferase (E2) component
MGRPRKVITPENETPVDPASPSLADGAPAPRKTRKKRAVDPVVAELKAKLAEAQATAKIRGKVAEMGVAELVMLEDAITARRTALGDALPDVRE